MSEYVFDTSALLGYLRNESGSETIAQLLGNQRHVFFMHRVNLGELYYGMVKHHGEKQANSIYGVVLQFPVQYIEDLSDPFLMTAGKLKVQFGLGFADSFAATTAILLNAVLITKDNDFRSLEKQRILSVLWA